MEKTLRTNVAKLTGTIAVPGDKSISHRAAIFGALATGTTKIDHFLLADDCQQTLTALKQLGVPVQLSGDQVTIKGRGFKNLQHPNQPINLGNSGTATRLLLGVLSKQPFAVELSGDQSLSKRPMARVTAPLRQMGANIAEPAAHLPLTIQANNRLQALDYRIPVASAQVKSALIFAALQADQVSHLTEIAPTRDHTERMLRQFGGVLDKDGLTLTITPQTQFKSQQLRVPGDLSSAAVFVLAATLVPNSQLRLQQVGLNNTRTGFLDVLSRMGANLRVENVHSAFEASGDLIVNTSDLNGTTIEGQEIANVIDELPLLALAATQAHGTTVIKDAAELRVKETDRIAAVATELSKLGAQIETKPDGLVIHGPTPLKPVTSDQLTTYGDHRIGLMLSVAALISNGTLTLTQAEAVNVSYPHFFADLQQVCH